MKQRSKKDRSKGDVASKALEIERRELVNKRNSVAIALDPSLAPPQPKKR